MTAHEKRAQRAELLLEIEEASQDLAAIQEKAIRLVEVFRQVLSAVEYAQAQSAKPVVLSNRRDPKEDLLEQVRTNDRYQVVNRESAVSIIQELSDARAKLDVLRQRKVNLAAQS
jgi:hypothetical protein